MVDQAYKDAGEKLVGNVEHAYAPCNFARSPCLHCWPVRAPGLQGTDSV